MTQSPHIGQSPNPTGLSEAELQRRAEGLVDVKTGKIRQLSALDAALVDAEVGNKHSTQQTFQSLSTTTADPHAIDDPAHAFTHPTATAQAGFAPSAAEPVSPQPHVVLDRAAKAGHERMMKSGLLTDSSAAGGNAAPVGGGAPLDIASASSQVDADSRNIQFELIKNQMQKMADAQNAISNVLNAMNDEAKTAINNSKA